MSKTSNCYTPGDKRDIVFKSFPSSVDQILQVKSSEVEIKYFSSISGWKAMLLTLSVWPFSSWKGCTKKWKKIPVKLNFFTFFSNQYIIFSICQITVVNSYFAINSCSSKLADLLNNDQKIKNDEQKPIWNWVFSFYFWNCIRRR